MKSHSLRLLDPDTTLDAVGLAYRTIRANVLDGTLPPSAVLSQVTLARELGISRTPLREALRQLTSEGLVVGDFNRRLTVTQLDLDDFDQIYAARIALEPVAVRSTVPLLGPADHEALEGWVNGMDSAAAESDISLFRANHRAFHLGLTSKVGARLERMLGELWDHSERYRLSYLHVERDALSQESLERIRISQLQHRVMLKAVRAGDAETCALTLVDHLAHTLSSVFEETVSRPKPRVAEVAIKASRSSAVSNETSLTQ